MANLRFITASLKSKLGEFWYYSLMLFCAMRVADVMNLFVGLWLVPKYIEQKELGAVIPLTSFATVLALPAYVFAMTFMKEVNTLAVHNEFGKMKSLMRGVFIGVGVFIVLAIIVSIFLLPLFLERIRIANGMLGVLILVSAFLGCVAPVYTNALQALKRFTALSVINIIGAPLRFVTMLVAMPFRPLSGYFVGQSASPTFSMAASIFCLRKELSVPAEPYWTRPVFKRFMFLFIGMTGYQLAGMMCGLVETTVLRQRIPEVESAAYYMVTRFSDISFFISTTLLMTLFPYTAELAEQGKSTRPLVVKSAVTLLIGGLVLAFFFCFFGQTILALLPGGNSYAEYSWAIPWVIGINTVSGIQSLYTNTEVSAGRFRFLYWWLPVNLFYVLSMQLVAGYGYFSTNIPNAANEFLSAHNFHALSTILWWMTVIAVVKLTFCSIEMFRGKN